jgi:hypothetical protein
LKTDFVKFAKMLALPVQLVENQPRAVIRKEIVAREIYMTSGSDDEEMTLVALGDEALRSKVKRSTRGNVENIIRSRMSLNQRRGLTRKSGAVGVNVGQKMEIVRMALENSADCKLNLVNICRPACFRILDIQNKDTVMAGDEECSSSTEHR